MACWRGFGKGADAANAKFPKGIGATCAPEAEMTRPDIRLQMTSLPWRKSCNTSSIGSNSSFIIGVTLTFSIHQASRKQKPLRRSPLTPLPKGIS